MPSNTTPRDNTNDNQHSGQDEQNKQHSEVSDYATTHPGDADSDRANKEGHLAPTEKAGSASAHATVRHAAEDAAAKNTSTDQFDSDLQNDNAKK